MIEARPGPSHVDEATFSSRAVLDPSRERFVPHAGAYHQIRPRSPEILPCRFFDSGQAAETKKARDEIPAAMAEFFDLEGPSQCLRQRQ
jgi:hypothetical protein